MRDSLRGPVFVLLSALCFSLSGTLQALAPEGATPFVVAAVRTLVGSSFLFAWCLWKRRLPGRWGDVPWRWVFACAAWLLTATLSFFFGAAEIGVAHAGDRMHNQVVRACMDGSSVGPERGIAVKRHIVAV